MSRDITEIESDATMALITNDAPAMRSLATELEEVA